MSRTVALAIGTVIGALAITTTRLGALDRIALVLVPAAVIIAVAARRILVARPLAAGVVGASLIALRVLALPLPAPALELPAGTGPWSARVESVTAPKDGHQRATIALLVEPAIRVALDAPRYPEVQPADRIIVSGAVRAPPDDDYGRYLRRAGIAGTLRSRTLEIGPSRADPFRAIEGLRRGAGDALALALPEPEAGLAAGILVGLRDRVDRDLAATFTAAGVSHVVAISGWNIAIVALLVEAALAAAPRRRRRLVTLAAIAIYTVLTGASASVLRAAAMAVAVTLARETGRAGSALQALALAVVVMLVIDPALVGDPGFQLSALATAGLVAWATPLTDWLRQRGNGRLPEWLCVGLGVSLAAQAATLPVVLASFGRLAALSPILNLAVVPLVPLAMAGGALALGVGALGVAGVPATIVTVLAVPGWLPLAALTAIVRAGAALPLASVTLEPPVNLVAAAVIPGVIAARWARGWLGRRPTPAPRAVARAPTAALRPSWQSLRRPLPRVALAAMTVAVVLAGLLTTHRPDGRLRIVALDVGQGDAILVEGPHGSRVLVDGGPDPDRLVAALDGRLAPWDRRIDLLLLTHPHEDHVAGLPLLLERYRIREAYDVGMRGRGPGYVAWELALELRGVARGQLAAGDAFTLDGVRFAVLWPDAGSVPTEPPDAGTGINNVSVVLLAAYGRQRALLMGDVEEGIDPILLSRGLPRADVLKVAHHGSRTSSTAPFLEAVHPSIAVISAGEGNPYGHPTPATLARLTSVGARIARTDLNGTVEVTLDGQRSELRLQRQTAAGPGGTPLQLVAAGLGCPLPAPRPPIREAGHSEPTRYDRTDASPPPDPRQPQPSLHGLDCRGTVPLAVRRERRVRRTGRLLLGRRRLRPRAGGRERRRANRRGRRAARGLARARRSDEPSGGRRAGRHVADVLRRHARDH